MDYAVIIILGLIFWIACGYAAYGMTFAYFQRKFPSIAEGHVAADKKLARLVFLVGPFGLLVSMCSGYLQYGFLYDPTQRTRRHRDRQHRPRLRRDK